MSVPAAAMLNVGATASAATATAAAVPAGEGAPAFPDCSVPHPSQPLASLPMPAMPVAAGITAAAPAPDDPTALPAAEALIELLLGGDEPVVPAKAGTQKDSGDTSDPASAPIPLPLPMELLPAPSIPVVPAAANPFLPAAAKSAPPAVVPADNPVVPAEAGPQSFADQTPGLTTTADIFKAAAQPPPPVAPGSTIPLPDFAALITDTAASPAFTATPAVTTTLPALLATAPPMTAAPTDPHWAQDMAERVIWSAREGLDEVEIQLHPPELGPVRVHLKLEGTELAVQVSAPQSAARDAFESNLPRLREQLLAQGLTLIQAQVSDQHRPQDREAPGFRSSGDRDADAGEPVAAQTLRLRRIGLLDEYA